MTTGLKYHAKEADQYKKELKEKPNMSKKANTGSTALLEERNEDQQQKAGPENTPKPPQIYITDVKNISLLV
jgi:hypothetical protein